MLQNIKASCLQITFLSLRWWNTALIISIWQLTNTRKMNSGTYSEYSLGMLPMAAVTNDHTLGSLKQYTHILCSSWGQKSQISFSESNSRSWQALLTLDPLRENQLPCFSQFLEIVLSPWFHGSSLHCLFLPASIITFLLSWIQISLYLPLKKAYLWLHLEPTWVVFIITPAKSLLPHQARCSGSRGQYLHILGPLLSLSHIPNYGNPALGEIPALWS